jgi:hypothetical protein
VTKRERELVEPLKVIDQNERRPDRERTMRSLENADRLEQRGVFRGSTEHEFLEPVPVRRRGSQRSEKLRGGSERHPRLRLEANDAKLIRHLRPRHGFAQ